MGVILYGGILSTLIFELKMRLGILKKTKKRKKSYKMTKKRGKKERKDEKLKRMMQKDALYLLFWPRGLSGLLSAQGTPMTCAARAFQLIIEDLPLTIGGVTGG